MKSKKRTRLLTASMLIPILILTSSLASCDITISIPDTTQPGSQSGNSQPEDSQSGSASSNNSSEDSQPSSSEVRIDFWADNTNLSAGDCTVLHWNTSGGSVYINGDERPPSGEYEICPDSTSKYKLELEYPADNLLGVEEITVNVSQAGNNNPPSSSGDNSGSSGSQTQPPPPANQPFSADLAVTDIFPGNQPFGQFHIRITNNGPGTPNKLKVKVQCSVNLTDKNNGKVTYRETKFNLNLSIKPGETQVFPTGIDLDTNVFDYMVGCEVFPTFDDPNQGNNYYEEPLITN